MKFAKNNLKNIIPFKIIAITMLGFTLYGCATPETQVNNTAPSTSETEQPQVESENETTQSAQTPVGAEALVVEEEPVEVLSQQQVAEQEQAKKAAEEKAAKLKAQQQAKLKAQKEAAEKLAQQQALKKALKEASEKAAQKEAAERLALQEAEAKRLTLLESQAEAEELARELAEQERELLAQNQEELNARVEEVLSRLADAEYAFKSKKEVVVGDKFQVDVVIQLDKTSSQSADHLPDSEFSLANSKLDEFVQIKLTSSNLKNLTITPISEELQSVSSLRAPKWAWSVTAEKEGAQTLLLNVVPLVNIKNPDGTLVQSNGVKKTISEVITVVAKPFNFWDWIATTTGMISVVMGGLFIGLMLYGYKRVSNKGI